MPVVQVGFCAFAFPLFNFSLPSFTLTLPSLPLFQFDIDLECPLND